MIRRKTIGANPLDVVVPPRPEESATTTVETAQGEAPTSTKVKKQLLTVHLPAHLVERVKNAVFWTPGLTLAAFAEMALAEAVERMEQERGEPFPPRHRPLKSGRPLK